MSSEKYYTKSDMESNVDWNSYCGEEKGLRGTHNWSQDSSMFPSSKTPLVTIPENWDTLELPGSNKSFEEENDETSEQVVVLLSNDEEASENDSTSSCSHSESDSESSSSSRSSADSSSSTCCSDQNCSVNRRSTKDRSPRAKILLSKKDRTSSHLEIKSRSLRDSDSSSRDRSKDSKSLKGTGESSFSKPFPVCGKTFNDKVDSRSHKKDSRKTKNVSKSSASSSDKMGQFSASTTRQTSSTLVSLLDKDSEISSMEPSTLEGTTGSDLANCGLQVIEDADLVAILKDVTANQTDFNSEGELHQNPSSKENSSLSESSDDDDDDDDEEKEKEKESIETSFRWNIRRSLMANRSTYKSASTTVLSSTAASNERQRQFSNKKRKSKCVLRNSGTVPPEMELYLNCQTSNVSPDSGIQSEGVSSEIGFANSPLHLPHDSFSSSQQQQQQIQSNQIHQHHHSSSQQSHHQSSHHHQLSPCLNTLYSNSNTQQGAYTWNNMIYNPSQTLIQTSNPSQTLIQTSSQTLNPLQNQLQQSQIHSSFNSPLTIHSHVTNSSFSSALIPSPSLQLFSNHSSVIEKEYSTPKYKISREVVTPPPPVLSPSVTLPLPSSSLSIKTPYKALKSTPPPPKKMTMECGSQTCESSYDRLRNTDSENEERPPPPLLYGTANSFFKNSVKKGRPRKYPPSLVPQVKSFETKGSALFQSSSDIKDDNYFSYLSVSEKNPVSFPSKTQTYPPNIFWSPVKTNKKPFESSLPNTSFFEEGSTRRKDSYRDVLWNAGSVPSTKTMLSVLAETSIKGKRGRKKKNSKRHKEEKRSMSRKKKKLWRSKHHKNNNNNDTIIVKEMYSLIRGMSSIKLDSRVSYRSSSTQGLPSIFEKKLLVKHLVPGLKKSRGRPKRLKPDAFSNESNHEQRLLPLKKRHHQSQPRSQSPNSNNDKNLNYASAESSTSHLKKPLRNHFPSLSLRDNTFKKVCAVHPTVIKNSYSPDIIVYSDEEEETEEPKPSKRLPSSSICSYEESRKVTEFLEPKLDSVDIFVKGLRKRPKEKEENEEKTTTTTTKEEKRKKSDGSSGKRPRKKSCSKRNLTTAEDTSEKRRSLTNRQKSLLSSSKSDDSRHKESTPEFHLDVDSCEKSIRKTAEAPSSSQYNSSSFVSKPISGVNKSKTTDELLETVVTNVKNLRLPDIGSLSEPETYNIREKLQDWKRATSLPKFPFSECSVRLLKMNESSNFGKESGKRRKKRKTNRTGFPTLKRKKTQKNLEGKDHESKRRRGRPFKVSLPSSSRNVTSSPPPPSFCSSPPCLSVIQSSLGSEYKSDETDCLTLLPSFGKTSESCTSSTGSEDEASSGETSLKKKLTLKTKMNRRNPFSQKKYIVAGLFSNYYKRKNREAFPYVFDSKKSGGFTYKASEHPYGLLPPPIYCGKGLRALEEPFTLPYDVYWMSRTEQLPLRDVVATWNYKKIKSNVYVDVKAPGCLLENTACSCKDNCGENCINRMTYTECKDCRSTCTNNSISKHKSKNVERFMTQKKGWGVRTKNEIKAGEFILEYVGEIVSEKEFKRRMLTEYVDDSHHYCLHLDGGMVIDGHRMGSECRFVNHSCEPNCEMQKWSVNGFYRMALFPLRNIQPMEELTYDYNFSLFNPVEGQDCFCGSSKCRGVIGGRSQYSKKKIEALNIGEESRKRKRKTLSQKHLTPNYINAKTLPWRPPNGKETSLIRKTGIFLFRNLEKRHFKKERDKMHQRSQDQDQRPLVIQQQQQQQQNHHQRISHAQSLLEPSKSDSLFFGENVSKEEEQEKDHLKKLNIVFESILTELMALKDQNDQILSLPFQVLPPKENSPSSYYDKLSDPIDFSLIKKKIESLTYRSPETFNHDVLLLFQNNLRFFGRESSQGSQIIALKGFFSRLKQEKLETLKELDVDVSSFLKKDDTARLEDIVQCICGQYKEEGLMIQCEGCQVWQHCDCVGGSQESEYFCEKCQPRPVNLDIQLVPQPEYACPGEIYYLSLTRGEALQVTVGDTVYVLRAFKDKNETTLPPSDFTHGGVPHKMMSPLKGPSHQASSLTKGNYPTYKSIDKLTADTTEMDIFRIERLWINDKGERFAFGHHYLRPHETFHEPTRKFFSNEVFRVPLYEVLPLESIWRQCWVLDIPTFNKGRPYKSSEEHVYICEYRVDKSARLFHKISKPKFPTVTKWFAFDTFDIKIKVARTYTPHEVPEKYARNSSQVRNNTKGLDFENKKKVGGGVQKRKNVKKYVLGKNKNKLNSILNKLLYHQSFSSSSSSSSTSTNAAATAADVDDASYLLEKRRWRTKRN